MPRIPDAADLGARPGLQAARPLANVEAVGAGVARGTDIFAQGAMNTARDTAQMGQNLAGVNTALQKWQDADNRLQLASARGALLSSKIELDTKYAEDQDYTTVVQRYTAELKQAHDNASKGIRSDYVRQTFDAYMADDYARAIAGMQKHARGQEKDATRSWLTDNIDMNVNVALRATDETDRARAFDNINESIAAVRGKGFINDVEAQKLRTSTPEKYATLRAAMLVDTDPAAAVKLLAPTGKTPEGDPIFAKTGTSLDYMPINKRAELYDKAVSAVRTKENQARIDYARAEEGTESDLAIGVARGEKGYTDIEAAYQRGQKMQPNGISAGARTRLTLHLDSETKKQNENVALIARAAAAGNGGPPLDPKNTNDKKGLNLLYDETAKGWANLPAEEVLNRAVDFSVQKGIAPESVRGMIRGGLRSGNPEQALLAANAMERMRNSNPQVLNDFAEEDLRLGHMIASQVSVGIPAPAALQLAQESLKVPEAERKVRDTDFEAQRGKDTATRQQSDTKWLESKTGSTWVRDPTVPASMREEFERVSKDEYIRTGNLEASRRFALDVVNRQWGHSDIGAERRWMKFAPEKFYGVPTLSPSENSAWMTEQLLGDVGANSISEKPLTKDRILLLPDPTRTGRDGTPTYLVSVLGEDGVLYPVTDKKGQQSRWVPNWETSKEFERRKKAQADEIARLRAGRNAGEAARTSVPVGVP